MSERDELVEVLSDGLMDLKFVNPNVIADLVVATGWIGPRAAEDLREELAHAERVARSLESELRWTEMQLEYARDEIY